MEQMHDVCIPPRNIIRSLAHCVGGLDELPYLKDDMKYHLYKCRKEQTKDGDAEALLAYLRGKKEVDGTYFLRYIEDVEGRLENLFWCDKKSRIDYKTFGTFLHLTPPINVMHIINHLLCLSASIIIERR